MRNIIPYCQIALFIACLPPNQDHLLGDSDRLEPNFGTSMESEGLAIFNISSDSSADGLNTSELSIEVSEGIISVSHGIEYYDSHDFIGSISLTYEYPNIIIDYGIVIDSNEPPTTFYALSYDIESTNLSPDTYTLKIQVDVDDGTTQSTEFIESEEFTIE